MPRTRSQTRDEIIVLAPSTPRSTTKKRSGEQDETSPSHDASKTSPRRTKKRVRFSDPGPSTTGLTPFVKNTRISGKRRVTSPPLIQMPSPPTTPSTVERYYVTTPMRETLLPRTRRSLARNHLSEEQNALAAEQRAERNALRTRQQMQIRDLTWELELARQDRIYPVEPASEDGGVQADMPLPVQDPTYLASPALTDGPVDFDGDEEGYDQSAAGTWNDEGFYSSPTGGNDITAGSPLTIRKLSFTKKTYSDTACQASMTDYIHSEQVAALELTIERLTGENGDLLASYDSTFGAFRTGLAELGFAPAMDDATLISTIRSAIRSTRLQLENIIPGETTCGMENGKELLAALIQHVRTLCDEKRDMSAKLRAQEQSEHNLRGNFNSTLARHEELMGRLEAVEDHRSDLIADLEAERDARHNESTDYEIELACRDDTIAQCSHRISELERLHDDLETSNSRLRAGLETYRTDLEKSDYLVSQLDEEKQALRLEISGLREQFAAISQTCLLLSRPGLKNVTMRRRRNSMSDECEDTSTEVESGEEVLAGAGVQDEQRHSGKISREGSYRDSGVAMLAEDETVLEQ